VSCGVVAATALGQFPVTRVVQGSTLSTNTEKVEEH
jgi:hypothetical protein